MSYELERAPSGARSLFQGRGTRSEKREAKSGLRPPTPSKLPPSLALRHEEDLPASHPCRHRLGGVQILERRELLSLLDKFDHRFGDLLRMREYRLVASA